MTMITIVEMLIRAPEGRLVFHSMLGTVSFTVAFVAGAMFLIQNCLFRFQRYNVILLHGSQRCAAIFFTWSRPSTTFLGLQPFRRVRSDPESRRPPAHFG
jgi:hypothetical protein